MYSIPALHLGCRLLGPEHICHLHLSLDVSPLLKRSEGIVDQPVQGHAAGLGQGHCDGGLARGRLRREYLDDEQEEPRPCGAEPRVKAPASGVKPLKGPEEALDGIRGRGEPGTAHAADALGHLLVHAADPGGEA